MRHPRILPYGEDLVAPTAERCRRGPVERPGKSIADEAGRPAHPYRAVDTLALMQRRGSITAGMRAAGERLRDDFTRARLHPLRAADLSRPGGVTGRPIGADGFSARAEGARRAVWRAIQAVGGLASPAGSCVWHVIGWEETLKEWALEQGWNGRRVSEETASGILVAALGVLERHFARV